MKRIVRLAFFLAFLAVAAFCLMLFMAAQPNEAFKGEFFLDFERGTLTVHLAVAAERRNKPVAVLDLDPQASATEWKDSRPDESPQSVDWPLQTYPARPDGR